MSGVGDTLGRYTLLKRLAVGGMGEVFLAAKPGPAGFGAFVALKVLREELAVDQQFVDMLVDEANISMHLNHQNVVSVLDLGEHEGSYYIAMEYVQGVTVERLMESLVARKRPLPIPAGLYIGTELCRALKYAHTRLSHSGEPLNIVHRDVTPANILLSTQGEVKLTDFGIARARGRIHQTQAGVLKGKFGYMAPEMIRYEALDARADIFCAGVVVYLMVAGRHPVAGSAVMEAIQRFEQKKIDPPSAFNSEVPAALDAAILKALEPRPEHRWSSAAAFGDALQDVILTNPQFRREFNEGAGRIAQLMRDVSPESFEEPVSRDGLASLLNQTQGDPRASKKGLTPPPARSRPLAAPPARAPDPPRPSRSEPRPTAPLRDTDSDELEAPTSAALASMDLDTDEALSMERVRRAREALDTDSAEPANLDATRGYDAILTENRAFEVVFPETSTDSRNLRDHSYEEGVIDRPIRADDPDDGATVVGYEQGATDEIVGAPTLALPAVETVEEDGRTVAGMSMPDWGALGVQHPVAKVVRDELSDDLDAATIVPPGPQPPVEASGDATILDGLDANQVHAALAAARAQAAEPRFNTDLMDQIVADSLQTGEHRAVDKPLSPQPLSGPIRIVLDADGAPAAPGKSSSNAADLLAQASSGDRPRPVAREKQRPQPVVTPGQGSVAQISDPLGVGSNTGRWMAGQLDANALSWDDDAAARRAVATRNQFPGHNNNTPQPAPVAPFPGTQSASIPHGVAAQPRSFARYGLILFLLGILVLGGVLGYLWFVTESFWPELEIDSSPQGATVILDGVEILGKTRMKIRVTPDTPHRLELRLTGFKKAVHDISGGMSRGRTYTLPATVLEREAPRVILPTPAKVWVNGKFQGEGETVALHDIPPEGEIVLKVEASGYQPYEVKFPGSKDIPAALDVALKAQEPPPPPPKRR